MTNHPYTPAEQLQALTSMIAKTKLAANEVHRVIYDEGGPSEALDKPWAEVMEQLSLMISVLPDASGQLRAMDVAAGQGMAGS